MLGYHDHYVVDGGQAPHHPGGPRDAGRRHGERADARPAVAGLLPPEDLRPHHVTGDTTYGTIENIVAIEDAGIRAYVPLPDLGSRRPPFFAQADFTYDAERDEYRCPQHHPLERETAKYSEEVVVYRAGPRPATPARSRPSAPRASTAASSIARSTPTTSRRCAATTRRRPTRRRCASGRCGSSRCSPRPSSGTAYAGSGCEACSTSILRGC